ncbi:MAG TPA: MFS transporter [Candidatus Ruania gallistercoris]|uniref:MFS transporter n=1 Tax=Candidatus Ruania gallistercoris TaxID=2838746 RepID=A0A9D2EHY5_9MICO|nr:MFS transporter [Candidatus Ruania gallistercoris]
MNHSAPDRASVRDWLGMGVLVLPALLASMDLSVLFMASPWISADLRPTASQFLWIMDIYGFMMAGLLITMGSLGDRIGRRRLLLIGAVAFGAASMLAAFAASAEMLIAARALLGFGGATLAPSTLSLIRGMFDDASQRRIAVGIWTSAFIGGVSIGPIIGGLLLQHFWWGSVFLINVPVMVLLVSVAPLLIRESRDPTPGKLDPFSAVLSLVAILPVVYGIKKMAEGGVDWSALTPILVGAGFGALFVARQLQADRPMIDIRLLRRPAFAGSIIANGAVVFAAAGMGLLAASYTQTVLGYAPFAAAMWMLPTVAGSFIGAMGASVLARALPARTLVPLGLGIAAGGFVGISFITPGSHIGMLVAGYSALTLGVGLTATLATSLVLSTAPPEDAGAASALAETSSEFGGAVGIAVLGTVTTAIYRSSMAAPTAAVDHVGEAAADTIGGAVAVAVDLPDDHATQLLQQAFAAYTEGFTMAALVGATVLAIAAVGTAAALSRRFTEGS